MGFRYYSPTELSKFTGLNVYNPLGNLCNYLYSTVKYSSNNVINWFKPASSNYRTVDFTPFNNSIFNQKFFTSTSNNDLGSHIVNTARKYLGYNEKNGSYKKFTNGRREAWCADYVTSVVKEAFGSLGKMLPTNFGSSSVRRLVSWAKSLGRYISKSASNIANYVKKGTIIIFGNNSHTGIVTGVGNGRIYTVEGNTSNKVAERSYSINSNYIKGFIQVA